jgi:hypothetical protein
MTKESVQAAEKTVSDLERKRAACIARGVELQDERSAVSFAAHADNDEKARARLDQINIALSVHASELASLDSALKAAGGKLSQARQAETAAGDRAKAQRLRSELRAVERCVAELDSAFELVCVKAAELDERTRTARALGAGVPNVEQFESYGTRCLLTHLGKLPPLWARRFELLQPRERCGFAERWSSWLAGAERGIAAKLGQQKTDTEEAAA